MFIRTEKSISEFIHFYPFVTIIVILNFMLWLFTGLFQSTIGDAIIQYGIGQNIAISRYGEYWRLITPIFLHADFGHFLFNSFSLVLFGPALERMVGKFRFIIMYMATGIIGNIATLLIEPSSPVPHLGASGAIYGLLGIYIYMSFRRSDLIDSGNAQIVRTISIIGIVMTFIYPNINVPGHIGGFIGGVILAPLLLRRARPFYKPSYRKNLDDDEVHFDPNRWNKRRIIPEIIRKNAILIIFIILVVLYVISNL